MKLLFLFQVMFDQEAERRLDVPPSNSNVCSVFLCIVLLLTLCPILTSLLRCPSHLFIQTPLEWPFFSYFKSHDLRLTTSVVFNLRGFQLWSTGTSFLPLFFDVNMLLEAFLNFMVQAFECVRELLP